MPCPVRLRGLLLGLMVAGGLVGCPDTTPPGLEITSVSISGSAVAGPFVLHVEGHGFLPESLTYDLLDRHGEAATRDVGLEVFKDASSMFPSDRVEVLSPRRIDGYFTKPLDPGSYSVRVRVRDAMSSYAVLERALIVSGPGFDAGVLLPPDSGEASDAEASDAAASDGGEDGGLPDASVPPPPFQAAFAFRQQVTLSHTSTIPAPAGTTFTVPVPHAALVAAGRSKPDASDIALYFGKTRLEHAFDDAARVGTDALVLVARLPEALSSTGFASGEILALYYGDPASTIAPSTAPFEVHESFGAAPPGWTLRLWSACNYDRATAGPTATAGAYCVRDAGNNPTRVTLSSPILPTVIARPVGHQVFEVSFQLAGSMASPNDVLYFALGPTPDAYPQATLLAPSNFLEGAPTASLTFRETDNANRTVIGWRLPSTRAEWMRARARFLPESDAPSLHFRFVSSDGTENDTTEVAIDDVHVRLAWNPEIVGGLGSLEQR